MPMLRSNLRPESRCLPLLEVIQYFEMKAVPKQRLMLMLPMKIDQKLRYTAKLSERHGFVIDLDFGAGRRKLPANDELTVLRLHLQRTKLFCKLIRQVTEYKLCNPAGLPLTNQIFAGLGPQCQTDGPDQYGFSGTGLTGQNI